VELQEAFKRAQEANLDLVEVAPHSRPPVCRIMDYGKHRYEESKKEQRARAKSKAAEMKEVRLGRTIKVDQHDIDIRVRKARKFLIAGHKVQITQGFRGREMQHRGHGREILNGVVEQLSDISKVETPPRQVGNRMHLILAPDKEKIQALLRAQAKEEARLAAEAEQVEADALAEKQAEEERSAVDVAGEQTTTDDSIKNIDDSPITPEEVKSEETIETPEKQADSVQ